MYDSIFTTYEGARIKGSTDLEELAELEYWPETVHLLFNVYQFITDIYNISHAPVGIKEVSQRFSREYGKFRRATGYTDTFTNFLKLMIHGGAPFYIYLSGKRRKSYIITQALYTANTLAEMQEVITSKEAVLSGEAKGFELTKNLITRIHEELDKFVQDFRDKKFDYEVNLKHYDESQAAREAAREELFAESPEAPERPAFLNNLIED